MRIKCEKLPLCYDFSNIEAYLNRAEVVEALGASGSWQSCNMVVNKLFMADFMTSYHKGTFWLGAILITIFYFWPNFVCNFAKGPPINDVSSIFWFYEGVPTLVYLLLVLMNILHQIVNFSENWKEETGKKQIYIVQAFHNGVRIISEEEF